MAHDLTDAQGTLVEALNAQTVAGKLPWSMVSSFPMTFITRVGNNTFILWRDVDDYPDLLALNSSYAVVIKSIRNLSLWLRVVDANPPLALEEPQQLAAMRGMTLMVNATEGAE